MKLYTLLHLEEKETSMHNAKVKNFRAQIELYIGCIINLQNSLKVDNISLTVITNNEKLLKSMLGADKINVVELSFFMKVPSGINFYADHFKTEVYKYFSTLDEPYVGLVDNDVICINNPSLCLKNLISSKIPAYYDITDQAAIGVGIDRIIKEKGMVSSTNKIGLWAGGEFIAGPPSFFALLYDEIMLIIDKYFLLYEQFHHQSVEFLSSVAIENIILANKSVIVDAGKIGIISRYWNADTLHVQNSLDAYTHSFLLHLPADKPMLAEAGKTNMSSQDFLSNYVMKIRKSKSSYALLKKSLKRVLK